MKLNQAPAGILTEYHLIMRLLLYQQHHLNYEHSKRIGIAAIEHNHTHACIILTDDTGPNAMNILVSFKSSMSLGKFATYL